MLDSTSQVPAHMRIGWRRAVHLMLTAILLFSTAAYALQQPSHAPEPFRPQPPQGAGIATHLVDLSPSDLDIKIQDIKASGATWVRTDLSWNLVQGGGPNMYNWTPYDRVVDTVHAHGLQVLFVVGLTPSWARPTTCQKSELCAPADPQAYSKFIGEAAERYAGLGVHSWEIWNEPNIAFRFQPRADVGLYVDMLKLSYQAVTAIDPDADILAASTAPSATNSNSFSPLDFVRAMYAADAAGSFTALSAHPYTLPDTPKTSGPHTAWGQLKTMHSVMAENGDSEKQIWITEFGAPTNGPSKTDGYVSEAVQAQLITEATAIWRNTTWGGPFFWYEFKDPSDNKSTTENFFGLLRYDGTPKPAYQAFQEAALTL